MDARRLLSRPDNKAKSPFLDWTERRTTSADTDGASAFWVGFQAAAECAAAFLALALLASLALELFASAASLLEEKPQNRAEAE